jgi:hypothetical protein
VGKETPSGRFGDIVPPDVEPRQSQFQYHSPVEVSTGFCVTPVVVVGSGAAA